MSCNLIGLNLQQAELKIPFDCSDNTPTFFALIAGIFHSLNTLNSVDVTWHVGTAYSLVSFSSTLKILKFFVGTCWKLWHTQQIFTQSSAALELYF